MTPSSACSPRLRYASAQNKQKKKQGRSKERLDASALWLPAWRVRERGVSLYLSVSVCKSVSPSLCVSLSLAPSLSIVLPLSHSLALSLSRSLSLPVSLPLKGGHTWPGVTRFCLRAPPIRPAAVEGLGFQGLRIRVVGFKMVFNCCHSHTNHYFSPLQMGPSND